MILYGLPTCSDCKAALKALADQGVTFRDIRADPLSAAEWAPLIAEFGDNLIDRKSQTYRNLNAWLRESEAEAQLEAQPALMARPVITDGNRWTLGWGAEAQAVWLG
ncbi:MULTISPECIES: arsenate reductase family protein [unclassified Yoonia]|uniref:arsenate reductase family protein n=1 Tax=unclassified Yoonia TaxID=2629118 RepID=UPI002AFEBFD7|nr:MULTISPECIES: ArsC/Spx/MgsR family protein [unclassified Yoonia]